MKKTTILLFILFFTQFSVAQNITIENKYLELINTQKDKFLIADNIRNAELCADSLLNTQNQDTINSKFLFNLAQSYFIIKKYDFSFFTILRQRCLFPNKKLENSTNSLLKASSAKLRQNIDIQDFINSTKPEQIQKLNYEQRIILLFQLTAKIHSKNLNQALFELTNLYQTKINSQFPFCMAQFRIFYFSKMPYIKQIKYIQTSKTTKNYTFDELISELPQKCRKKISKKTHNTII